jgi:hypothetical protein
MIGTATMIPMKPVTTMMVVLTPKEPERRNAEPEWRAVDASIGFTSC